MTLSPSHPQHLAPTSLGNAHSRQTCDITANGSRDHQAIDDRSQPDCPYGESRNGQIRLPQLLHRDSGTKTCAILKTRGRQSGDNINDTQIAIRRHSMPGGTAGQGPRGSIIRAPIALMGFAIGLTCQPLAISPKSGF